MVAPFSKSSGKIWVVSCLNTGKHVFLEVSFQRNRTMDFQNSPLFERSACFYVTITGNFERFQYFNFEKNFLIRENFKKKKKKNGEPLSS